MFHLYSEPEGVHEVVIFAARIGQSVWPADSLSPIAEARARVPGWPYAAIPGDQRAAGSKARAW